MQSIIIDVSNTIQAAAITFNFQAAKSKPIKWTQNYKQVLYCIILTYNKGHYLKILKGH